MNLIDRFLHHVFMPKQSILNVYILEIVQLSIYNKMILPWILQFAQKENPFLISNLSLLWCNHEYHLHPNIVCLLSNQLTWVLTDTNSDKNNLWSYLQIMYSVYILDVTREMIFTNDCIILPWWVSGVIAIWSTTIRIRCYSNITKLYTQIEIVKKLMK